MLPAPAMYRFRELRRCGRNPTTGQVELPKPGVPMMPMLPMGIAEPPVPTMLMVC